MGAKESEKGWKREKKTNYSFYARMAVPHAKRAHISVGYTNDEAVRPKRYFSEGIQRIYKCAVEKPGGSVKQRERERKKKIKTRERERERGRVVQQR